MDTKGNVDEEEEDAIQLQQSPRCDAPLSPAHLQLASVSPRCDEHQPEVMCNRERTLMLEMRVSSDALERVCCHLETKELWQKFHELGTEMIITKSGRYVCT